MPIAVAFVVVAVLGWLWVKIFSTLEASFGLAVAIGQSVVFVIIVIAILRVVWQRIREVQPNVRDGKWTHRLKGGWGMVQLAANGGFWEIELNGKKGSYTFRHVQRAESVQDNGAWHVDVYVDDATNPVWRIPVKDRGEARQWRRIFERAKAMKLQSLSPT